MSPLMLFIFVMIYFCILLVVAYHTSKNSTNESFFIGNKSSNWMLVAFGMIGTSLSGVTFVSVPGTVGKVNFSYFQVVLGYFIGYIVIAYILLPLYYKLNLTSIYNYLLKRFGLITYKTGSLFFIISRTLGATARLYLVINVLQIFILDQMQVPFWITTLIILGMILLYTFRGGVKTIVWTDTLQTTFMLLGLVICMVYIMHLLQLNMGGMINQLTSHGYMKVFNTDVNSSNYFLKQIIGGAFITIAMTGLDQEMMQKNISVKTLKDSQKNMVSFSFIIIGVNFLFLLLGGLLYLFANRQGIKVSGDDLFPTIALQMLPKMVSIIFIIALISALFPSADGAITALTSSFCIDILGIKRNLQLSENSQKRIRHTVHVSFAVLFMFCVMAFKVINNKSIIGVILKVAAYTYGPLLGLFAFGIFTKRKLEERWVPAICLAAPILCYLIETEQSSFLNNYHIGIELLLINGLLTYLGIFIISKKPQPLTDHNGNS